MNILFRELTKQDFELLLKWLETPHVKAWWDNELIWTIDTITQKYSNYVDHFKIEQGKKKSIFAFIILLDEAPVGYIQYYDARDFLAIPAASPVDFQKIAAIDFYLGEQSILGQGIGSRALKKFIQEIIFQKFDTVVVTPNVSNQSAITCYQKADFVPWKINEKNDEWWFIIRKGMHHGIS